MTILSEMIEQQSDPTIAPYAKTGEVTLRLSTKALSQVEADTKFETVEKEILEHKTFEGQPLSEIFYGYGMTIPWHRWLLSC